MTSSPWFDALWNLDEGWTPPLENVAARSRLVQINRDPFAIAGDTATANFRQITAFVSQHAKHTFSLITRHPETMCLTVKQCAESTGPRSVGVNTHSSIIVPFPPPNLLLGTIVSHQAAARVRLPALSRTPAARRVVLFDPLGALDLSEFDALSPRPFDWLIVHALTSLYTARTDTVELQHIESALRQCADRRIPGFVSCLGNNVWDHGQPVLLSRGGADMNEWPRHLRQRQRIETTWNCPEFVPSAAAYAMCEYCGAPMRPDGLKLVRKHPACPHCRERFEHPTQITPSIAAFEIRAQAQTQLIMSGLHNIEAIRETVEREADHASPAEAAALKAAAQSLRPVPEVLANTLVHRSFEAIAICSACEQGRKASQLLISTDGRIVCQPCFQHLGGSDARRWEKYIHYLAREQHHRPQRRSQLS